VIYRQRWFRWGQIAEYSSRSERTNHFALGLLARRINEGQARDCPDEQWRNQPKSLPHLIEPSTAAAFSEKPLTLMRNEVISSLEAREFGAGHVRLLRELENSVHNFNSALEFNGTEAF
jgi:hypothetical protein